MVYDLEAFENSAVILATASAKVCSATVASFPGVSPYHSIGFQGGAIFGVARLRAKGPGYAARACVEVSISCGSLFLGFFHSAKLTWNLKMSRLNEPFKQNSSLQAALFQVPC